MEEEAESETMKWCGGDYKRELRRYIDMDGSKGAPNYHRDGD